MSYINMRYCRKCGVNKPRDANYTHLRLVCNQCWQTREDYYTRWRHSRICTQCQIEKPKTEFYKADKNTGRCHPWCKVCTRAWHKKHRAANPEQRAAHMIVRQAIKSGRLVRPDSCAYCERSGLRIVGHHDDYSKPLDVIWLCHACHRYMHAFFGGLPDAEQLEVLRNRYPKSTAK